MSTTRRYHNATQVLPAALLRQVQECCHGLLYVPRAIKASELNRMRVLSLKAQGLGTGEIARRLQLTPRAVRKIVAIDRERASTLLPDRTTTRDVYRP